MIHSDYTDLLAEIKQKINEAQVKVVAAANSQLLWLYWQLGTYILENQKVQGWGAKIIERLSKDLYHEYPQIKGFSIRNLKYMRSFAEAYPVHVLLIMNEMETAIKKDISIVQQVVALLENKAKETVQPLVGLSSEEVFSRSTMSRVSWSHHIILLDKIKSLGQRFWYMLNTIEHGVSRNILAMQIASGLFDRQVTAKKISNFERTLPKPQTDFANYLMKDPYIFDFVQAKEKEDERNIEEQLATNITKFYWS